MVVLLARREGVWDVMGSFRDVFFRGGFVAPRNFHFDVDRWSFFMDCYAWFFFDEWTGD